MKFLFEREREGILKFTDDNCISSRVWDRFSKVFFLFLLRNTGENSKKVTINFESACGHPFQPQVYSIDFLNLRCCHGEKSIELLFIFEKRIFTLESKSVLINPLDPAHLKIFQLFFHSLHCEGDFRILF